MVKQKFPLYLTDEAKIYRAVLRKDWIDPYTNTVDAKAFMLRFKRNPPETTISTAPSRSEAINVIRSGKTFGVIEIKVKDIRELGLNVVQDSQTHISIIGIPCDEQNVKDYAIKLAAKSILLD